MIQLEIGEKLVLKCDLSDKDKLFGSLSDNTELPNYLRFPDMAVVNLSWINESRFYSYGV